MPIGLRQFIDALHKAIEGESISGNMSEEAVNKFAKFVGLQLDGAREIVQEMVDDMRMKCG